MDDSAKSFKVLILGDMAVGKTCFLVRFCEGKFEQSMMSTIGIDFRNKYLMHEGQKIELELWDTAGQERFRSITKNYFKGTDGIILLYDITNRTTYSNVKTWMMSIEDMLNIKDLAVVICGNKCDCSEEERTVSKEEGEKIANQYKVKFLETSSKSDINIKETFIELIDTMNRLNLGKNKTRMRANSKLERNKNKVEKKECNC